MFSFLRSKMKVVFIIVAIAFLVTIFAFWGMDIDSSQFRGAVAISVNGDDISTRMYEETVSRYLEQYRGQDITDAMRRQIRKQAAEDLVDAKILQQTSEEMGLYVTMEEMKGHVRAEFPNDDVYRSYLQRAPAAWWQNLEEQTDRRIKISRARWPLMDAVYVSDSEWSRILSDLFWEADVSHMLFYPSREVGDSEVFEYYETHRHRILEPTRVRPRQILFKLPMDAPDTDVHEITALAQKVLDLAKAGKDFGALAKKYSEAPDAEEGGDMGFYAPGELVQEVENVVFALNAGQIGDTFIRTEFGLHILKVEDRIPATIRPWSEELLEELRPQVVNDTHWESAKTRAQQVLDVVQKFPEQFSVLAMANSQSPAGKKGGRVGWIPRLVFPSYYEREHLVGEVTQGSVIEREIGRGAFEAPIGGVHPNLVRTTFGWHILKVHDRRPIAEPPPTDTDAAIVRATYQRLLSEETLTHWLQSQRKKARIKYEIDFES